MEESNQHEYERAYNKALKLLSIREHSAKELGQKLSRFPILVVEDVLKTLQEKRYQDDTKFAAALMDARLNAGKGRIFIQQEFRKHNITEEVLQWMMGTVSDEQWKNHCYRAWQKKFFSRRVDSDEEKRVDDFALRNKQRAFLSMRGFVADDWSGFL